ncbi:rhomboid family intramembrane serine protease [Cyanobacterium sp. Dongsha4]|uniref:rhomboid family intramembrane serine protease n=1 Tax=Cyanobacterium sp. DS4 TaxID=2878255 RepID=UPI002E80A04C|nr:rhomboid family intramembrane serine protease [Cyanobacterium sp. Dongsha4]WVK99445.1 rhomboid family intramembrane serine protease [Cyanobacterium sp. Dongsha4]
MSDENLKALAKEVKIQFTILGVFVIIFWLIEIINLTFFGDRLDYLGIIPRNLTGLRGIILAPFLHGDIPHLIANTFPFIILGFLTMLRKTSDFFIVTFFSMIVSGLGVWLFASPNSVTVGASGVIFGFLGFLMFRGLFQKNIPSIAVSLIVIFLYGGMVWGVLPTDPRISWLAHLFGFLGGVLAAKFIADNQDN